MSRRFTLFAILTAVCLLFSSCGALLLKAPASNKGSIVIPLRSSDRKANSPSELCTRFVFTIENADFKDTAEGTSVIEFKEIPFGTYTLTGTAYGKLNDEAGAQEEIVATCKVENLVINSPEPKAVTATFILSEATLIYFKGFTVEEPNPQGGAPITVTYTGTDKKTKLSETVTTEDEGTTTTTIREYAIDADGNNQKVTKDGKEELFVAKKTKTEPQSTGDKITVTEWDYNEGAPIVSKETVTEPDGKKTISEFRLNTATEGCAKRVTIEEGNTTTVEKFDSNEAGTWTEKVVTTVEPTETKILTYDPVDINYPTSEKVIESTKTTTKEFVTGSSKTAKVTEEITSGKDKGQKTVTEYNTQLSGQTPVRSTVTITYPDERTEVQTYNNNDKLTRKEETISAVSTVTLYNYDTVNKATSETLYASGYSPDQGTSVSDQSNAIRTITRTYDENDQEVKLAITDFEYDDNIIAYKADDASATEIPPYKTITTVTTSNGISTTSVTTFDYSKDSNSSGKLADKTTKVDGVETEYERFTYAADGLLDTESYKTLTETGYTTKETVWRYDSVHVIVKDRDATSTTLFDKQGGSVRCSSTVTKTFDSSGIEQDSKEEDNGVAAEAVLDFLSQNYYVGGSSLANLNFINDSSATASQYKYFYHVDFADFYKCHNGCFKYDPIKNGTLTCYLHNDKNGCSNFWDATINDSNGTSQKFSSHIKGSNLGTAGN